MEAKEYLSQTCRLNEQINVDIRELDELRDMARTISSPGLKERYNASKNTEAPFVRTMEKIIGMEENLNQEIDKLVDLKDQIRRAMDSVTNSNERLVLQYRYLQNLTWEDIGIEMDASPRTIRRWHKAALAHLTMPKDPIRI